MRSIRNLYALALNLTMRQHVAISAAGANYSYGRARKVKRMHASAYVNMRQHTSACVSTRQHTYAGANYLYGRARKVKRMQTSAYVCWRQLLARPNAQCKAYACVSIRQHTSAYVSISAAGADYSYDRARKVKCMLPYADVC